MLSICCFSLSAQEKRIVSCVLLSAVDSTPISLANIINYKANIGTSSNLKGEFTITIYKDDTLMISEIGYQTIEIHEANLSSLIYLYEKHYELDQFSVLPYTTYQEFKDAFVKVEIPDNRPKLNRSIFLSVDELKRYDGSRGFGGGISALLAMFNKQMKDKKNYERLLQQDKYEAVLATKFNPEMVKRITKFNDPKKLDDFIQFCDFNNAFIEHSSKYDLITQIHACYDEYTELTIVSK